MVFRIFTAAVATLALASAASSATLTVVADQAQYVTGSTITLTVTGDTEGGTSILAFGRLLFDNPAVANFASGTPNQSPLLAFGSIPWLTGPLVCTSSSCEMMNQISPITATAVGSTIPLIATVTFLAGTPGITNVNWDTNSVGGFALDFFGLTDAAGTSFEVIPVPEPTTAALLGLGLLGLTVAGRRRA